ncbi:hypothetical protein DYB38_000938 [Aphanomyces astaci]|uniref:Poly(A) RNA polymerase mitochondrial-like central palm domain-containing protein n=1 Tax=Aphanomyces astaci TaxID=112090 RepID=A0A397E0V1_APHAT|nr:hypothetical protein DYB38_000938 [Aphanomyces astaci]
MRDPERHLDESPPPMGSPSELSAIASKMMKHPKTLTHAAPDDDSSLHPGHFKRKTNKLPTPVWFGDPSAASTAASASTLAGQLTSEVHAFVAYTNTEVESAQNSVQDSIARLNATLDKKWPEAACHATCFGSFASGLWLPTSDVDVVVHGIPSTDLTSTQEVLAALLSTEPWVRHVSVVGTKVMVVKVILKHCGRRMDIAVETADTQHGLAATEIVRAAVMSIPVMRPLVLVLKTFLREKGLNNAFTGGLSSYALVLLCLHYLLHRPHNRVIASSSSSESDDGDNDVDEHDEVGTVLLGFLEYFGTIYDHRCTGITWFINPVGHLESVEYERKVRQGPLVLDDPIHPHDRGVYNVGAGAYAMARVVTALENAFYATTFHRPSRFTPTPLSQMIHWSGPVPGAAV